MADTATRPIVEDVSLKDLKAGLADGSIVLVDVREPHEFCRRPHSGFVAEPAAELRPPTRCRRQSPVNELCFPAVPGAAQSLHSASRSKPAATTFARIILVGFWDGKAQASGVETFEDTL